MGYLQARSDLGFIVDFRNSVVQLLNFNVEAYKSFERRGVDLREEHPTRRFQQSALREEASKIAGYEEVRTRVVKGQIRAIRIANKLSVVIDGVVVINPGLGGTGPTVRFDLFSAITDDPSISGISPSLIMDALTRTIGACEAKVQEEWLHSINPLYWVRELLVFIIRIPFMIIQASGFDVGKAEDHALSKIVKLLEIIAIIFLLISIGLNTQQVQDFIKLYLLRP